MLTTLEVRGKALMGSMARNRIGMRVLNGNIISAIQYHLSTIVLTETQMTNLEKKVGIIAKTVTGLPLSVSKDFPHIPTDMGGLGCQSLRAVAQGVPLLALPRIMDADDHISDVYKGLFEMLVERHGVVQGRIAVPPTQTKLLPLR